MARPIQRNRVLSLFATYGAWLLSVLLAAGFVWIARSDVLGLLLLGHANQYVYALLDEVSFFLLVLAWFVFTIVSETWHSRSSEKGTLTGLMRRLDGSLLVSLVIAYAIYRIVL
ncbi:MAG TPA: hypothetical protein VMW65_02600 [Chloroflexota bacterium]|nr:hypothetical protein [Chloroflexota bacterium]